MSNHPEPHRGDAAVDGPDGGQAMPIVIALVAILAVVVLAIGEVGVRLADRQRAQQAADAAALAGVSNGRDAAARIAAANGATLVSFRDVGDVVTVEVRVGESSAVAAATDGP